MIAGKWCVATSVKTKQTGLRRDIRLDSKNSQNTKNINELAKIFFEKNEFSDCIKLCDKSLKINYKRNVAWILLSKALLKSKDNIRALEIASAGLKHFPGNEHLLACIITASYSEELPVQTIKAVKKLKRKLGKLDSNYQNVLAISYARLGNLEEAKKKIILAINQDPKNSELYNSLANFYGYEGANQSALKYFARCVELKPESTGAIYNFAKRKKFTSLDQALIENITLRFKQETTDIGKIHLGQTLAHIADNMGDYQTAAHFWVLSGALQQKRQGFKLQHTEAEFRHFRHILPMSSYEYNIEKIKGDHKIPIFIVGLPRSGTSLLEQMISNHSDVTGLGEKNWIPTAINKFSVRNIQDHAEICQITRNYYFTASNYMQINTSHFTDKLPLNSCFIGLITNAIPEAKIIYISRDANATCFSCFKSFFSSSGLAWTFDQQSVVNYHRLHLRHMQAMQASFPGRFLNVGYENLVNNPELEMRKIIDFCDLKFQNSVLEPEKNNRVILTASNEQVTRKIYKNSNESWKKYKEYLPILFSERGNFV
jgi:tetratricopeptide (TPR) repeat protein